MHMNCSQGAINNKTRGDMKLGVRWVDETKGSWKQEVVDIWENYDLYTLYKHDTETWFIRYKDDIFKEQRKVLNKLFSLKWL